MTGGEVKLIAFSRWREKVPTAKAGMPERTAELARRASAMDGASKADEGGRSGCHLACSSATLTRRAVRADLSRRRER